MPEKGSDVIPNYSAHYCRTIILHNLKKMYFIALYFMNIEYKLNIFLI